MNRYQNVVLKTENSNYKLSKINIRSISVQFTADVYFFH